MRHRKNSCVLFKVTTISKKSRNRIQVAQLLFCVQCTKPTSPCAIHFSSDRNIKSRGWSAQQRSPQLDFPIQLPLGTSDSALCTADSSRICGFPHNRMSQYYNAAFLQQKKVLEGQHFGHLPEIPKKCQHNNPVTLSMLL